MVRLLILLLFLTCLPVVSHAGVSTVQALSFGSVISKKNDAVYEITVNTDGSYAMDAGGFIEIDPPQEGIYDIDGLAVSTAIVSVTVTEVNPLTAAGLTFNMINFQETHPATTDGSGVARITIGGTARSTGSGTPYPDRTYSGTVNIQINF